MPILGNQSIGWILRAGLAGLLDPSLRALSGHLKFTARRHKFNKDSLHRVSWWNDKTTLHARPFEPSIKSIFLEILTTFGDKCPQNGSKNDKMAPRTTSG